MELRLDPAETRVLGALIEKEVTTPEYYPLSLNALVNACNQKSNREPAVTYEEDFVRDVTEALRHKGLLIVATGAGSRVPKFGQRLVERLNLGRRETAVLCELMLRGPQTLGELRGRTERMHRFEDTSEVELVLDRLPDMFRKLPRRTGEKEARYAQLLSGEPSISDSTEDVAPAAGQRTPDRFERLSEEIQRLRAEVSELQQQFANFRRQFD